MTERTPALTERDHAYLTAFLNQFFDRASAGSIEKETFTGVLAQVIAAVDIGNMWEVRCHLEEGRDETKLRLLLDEK